MKNRSAGRENYSAIRNHINCSTTDRVTRIQAYAQAVSCPCLVASTSGTPRDQSRFRYVAQATTCIYRHLRKVEPTDSYSEHHRLHLGSVTEPHRRIFRVLRQCESYHNRSIPHQNTTATCHALYNFSFTNHYFCTAKSLCRFVINMENKFPTGTCNYSNKKNRSTSEAACKCYFHLPKLGNTDPLATVATRKRQ